jgi:hypothetical protein
LIVIIFCEDDDGSLFEHARNGVYKKNEKHAVHQMHKIAQLCKRPLTFVKTPLAVIDAKPTEKGCP